LPEVIGEGVNSFSLRPFQRRDRVALFRLLDFLPDLYPNGQEWLDRKLNDVLDGKAYCTLLGTSGGLLGVTIETPKGSKRVKLSTIYVHPIARRRRSGVRLLQSCVRNWESRGYDQASVTVDLGRCATLSPLLINHGFNHTLTLPDRYGPNRDEAVFEWRPIG